MVKYPKVVCGTITFILFAINTDISIRIVAYKTSIRGLLIGPAKGKVKITRPTTYFGAGDNLSAHKPSAFYKVFEPSRAEVYLDWIIFVFTPVHGSWLNMTEIEHHK